MTWINIFVWWWIISSVISIVTLLLIRVKPKVFLVLVPACLTLAWLFIPLFFLSYILTFLKVRKLDKDESIIDKPRMDSEK